MTFLTVDRRGTGNILASKCRNQSRLKNPVRITIFALPFESGELYPEAHQRIFFKNRARVIRHSKTHTHVRKVQNGTDTQNFCVVITG